MKLIGPAINLLLAGCAASNANGPPSKGQPEIALRRGGIWETFTFAPPHISGPTVELELDKGALHGFVGGAPMNVHIDNDTVSGYGPSGPIQMEIEQREGDVVVGGMWNGGPVHFTFDSGSLKGLVVWRRGRSVASEQACSYDMGATAVRGTLVGTSACGGMPVGARLEVDPRVAQMMTPTEMTVVLVAALASPP